MAGFLIAAGSLIIQQSIGIQSAEGHGTGQNDHINRPWREGSRCVGPGHLTNRHGGSATNTEHHDFTGSAYVVGAGNGTGAVSGVRAKVSYADQWRVDLSWKAPGFHNDTWACQPYAYVMQRKVGNGNWEHWESDRRYPATVRSSKRHGKLGGLAAYSSDTTSTLRDLNTLTTVYYRVCGVSRDPYNVYIASSKTASDLTTFTNALRSCVTSNAVEVGGDLWEPAFSRVDTDTFNEGNNTIYVRLQSSSNPARTTTTTIQWAVNDWEGSCNVAVGNYAVEGVSFSTSGSGVLPLPNPNDAENTFEDDCQVTYRLQQRDVNGSWRAAGSFVVYVKDTSPISIEFSTRNTDPRTLSEDGPVARSPTVSASNGTIWPNQLTVNVFINGATTAQPSLNCPNLAAFTQTISSTPLGGASSSDYSLSPQELVLGGAYSNCTGQFVVEVNNDGNTESSSERVRIQFDTLKRIKDDSSISTAPIGTWASSRTFTLSFIDENDNDKVGVGFASNSYTTRSGDSLTVRAYGYNYADAAGRSECDANSAGEFVGFKVKLYDLNDGSNSSVLSKSAQVKYSCYTDITLQIPDNGAGTLEMRIEDLDSEAEARNNATATATVLSDNTDLNIVPTTSLNEGTTRTVSFRLTAQPTDDVTVSTTGRVSDDIVLSPNLLSHPGTLTFTPSNWSRSQSLTITANQDGNTRDGGGTLNFRATSNDVRYDGERASLAITATDDDSPAVQFTSFSRPILYRNDKVAVRATFPNYRPNSTDACRIEYIEILYQA